MGDKRHKQDDIFQANFRLRWGLVDRVDAHAKRIERRQPGVKCSRVEALTALLLDALDRAEAADK